MAIAFGPYQLDLRMRQLFRSGTELRISPKALDLLGLLIENRTRALPKAELHERLWPATFVSEANLASLVAELRRVLDDPPDASIYVRTVHRFGYAFCGQVTDGTATAGSGASCWIVWKDQEIAMKDGENVIGRDPDATVRVNAPSVSRRHARISVLPDGAVIEDLGSKNGTFIGERRITAKTTLADLDELSIGSVQMRFRIVRGAEPTQTMER
jgi:DNA-binding winged helix-turn-helix (wHTH) protein